MLTTQIALLIALLMRPLWSTCLVVLLLHGAMWSELTHRYPDARAYAPDEFVLSAGALFVAAAGLVATIKLARALREPDQAWPHHAGDADATSDV